MKKESTYLKAKLGEAFLLKYVIESLAQRKTPAGYHLEKTGPEQIAIESSSVEAFVSGNIYYITHNIQLSLPFTTSFLFTCIKTRRTGFSLNWVLSLS